jgi:hypothetical protein
MMSVIAFVLDARNAGCESRSRLLNSKTDGKVLVATIIVAIQHVNKRLESVGRSLGKRENSWKTHGNHVKTHGNHVKRTGNHMKPSFETKFPYFRQF